MFDNYIGKGQFREVYTFGPNVAYVIKYEYASRSFSNVYEWDIWAQVKGTVYEKYFAPCLDISHSGSFLIQSKTDQLPRNIKKVLLPEVFACDLKRANLGLYNGEPVLHDYGNHAIYQKGLLSSKIKWLKIKD